MDYVHNYRPLTQNNNNVYPFFAPTFRLREDWGSTDHARGTNYGITPIMSDNYFLSKIITNQVGLLNDDYSSMF